MRLYVAIEFPDHILDNLMLLTENLHGFKWVRRNQLHLTLRFLGDVDQHLGRLLIEKLAEIRHSSFQVALSGLGVFPDIHHPRILWVGINANDTLFDLQGKIEQAIIDCGVEPETREFHPHITLSRIKYSRRERLESYMKKHRNFSLETITITSFHLVESKLHQSGSVYQNLKTYSLD